MNKRIIYTRQDGGVSLVIPAEGFRAFVQRSDAVVRYCVDSSTKTATAVLVGPDTTATATGAALVDTVPEGTVVVPQGVIDPSAMRPETDDELCARVMAKDVPADAIGAAVRDVAELPGDFYFFDAWTHDVSTGVGIDMAKARGVHTANIRAARNKKLDDIDAANTAVLRRVAAGVGTQGDKDTVAALEAQKQPLRDLPATVQASVNAAAIPETLKAIWPTELA